MLDARSYTAQTLQDSAIDPETLAHLATFRPDLRPAILSHPNCYPELAAWIGEDLPPLPPNGVTPPDYGPPAPKASPVGTDWSSTTASNEAPPPPPSRSRLPWIVATAVAVVAIGVGVVLLFALDRDGSKGDFENALAGLETSIQEADASLQRARAAVVALDNAPGASENPSVATLSNDASAAISLSEDALDNARKTLEVGRQEKVTPAIVQQISAATETLDGLTAALDEVAESVEEVTQELHDSPAAPSMDLDEVMAGNYQSIVGSWGEGLLQVEPTVITWNGFFAGERGLVRGDRLTVEGFGDCPPIDNNHVSAGPNFYEWSYELCTGSPIMSAVMGFYPAGMPATDPMLGGIVPTDETRDRILAVGGAPSSRWPTTWGGELTFVYRDEDGGSSSTPNSEADAACIAPVPGAYACAGGPIPADAKPLPAQVSQHRGELAALQTPSKNITCGTDGSGVACYVGNWDSSLDPDYNVHVGGIITARVPESGPAGYGQQSDEPMWLADGGVFRGETLPYGSVWYYRDFVFASEEAGLTVWNANSGYGALINRDGMFPFGP